MNARHWKYPIVILGLIALVGSTPASGADPEMPFFDFAGFSYLDGPAWQVGTVVTVVARLNEIQPEPIWPLEPELYEYTVVLEGLTIASVLDYGGIYEVSYSGGAMKVYRDDSYNSVYAENPPNALVPSTFLDGTAELLGDFTEMVLLFDASAGVGTLSGLVNWTAGDKLPLIEDPEGWIVFGGVSDHAGLGIPEGYDLAWDPQFYGPTPPVPVEAASWGSIKARFGR